MIDKSNDSTQVNIKCHLSYILNNYQNIYTLPEVAEYINILLHDHINSHYRKIDLNVMSMILAYGRDKLDQCSVTNG